MTSTAKRMDRFSQLAVIAAKEAYEQSGSDSGLTATAGVLVSSGIGGLATIEREHAKALEKGFDRISFFIPMNIANPRRAISIELGARGMCSCVVIACAGESHRRRLSLYPRRLSDVMVAGGGEAAITPLGIGGWQCAPCAKQRPRPRLHPVRQGEGVALSGRGGGNPCFEDYEHAGSGGHPGEVVGYGASCDAHHITAPCPDGAGAASAMKQAIADAEISPEQIGYINAHGTSTPLNDSIETAAVKLAFGQHARSLSISSTKSMTGHMLGASGAVEAVITAMAVPRLPAPHHQLQRA